MKTWTMPSLLLKRNLLVVLYDVWLALHCVYGYENVLLFTYPRPWGAAKRDCVRQNLRLVDIADEKERNHIFNTVYNASCQGYKRFSMTWTGLYYNDEKSASVWSENTTFEYSANFPEGESLRFGKCGAIGKDKKFMALPCESKLSYICEGEVNIPPCQCEADGICCNGKCFCGPYRTGTHCEKEGVLNVGVHSDRQWFSDIRDSNGACEKKGLGKYNPWKEGGVAGSPEVIHPQAIEQALMCGIRTAMIPVWFVGVETGKWVWRDDSGADTTPQMDRKQMFWGKGEPNENIKTKIVGLHTQKGGMAVLDINEKHEYLCLGGYDVCASNPCKNGANCCKVDMRYVCTCPEGFMGSQCEKDLPGRYKVLQITASFATALMKCEIYGMTMAEIRNDEQWVDVQEILPKDSILSSLSGGDSYRISLWHPRSTYYRWETSNRGERDANNKLKYWNDGAQHDDNSEQCAVVGKSGWSLATCDRSKAIPGILCEDQKLYCADTVCENGGECEDTETAGYHCHCPHHYAGKNCEYYLDALAYTYASLRCLKEYKEAYSDVSNRDTMELKAALLGELTTRFRDAMQEVEFINIMKFRNGSVIVDLEIACLASNETFKPSSLRKEIEAVLRQAVDDKMIGDVPVDPDYVIILQVGMDQDECMVGPCHNGGNCTNLPGSYSCQCPQHLRGANCRESFRDDASVSGSSKLNNGVIISSSANSVVGVIQLAFVILAHLMLD